MTREDDGDYECFSFNKHGNHSAVTRMNVLCEYLSVLSRGILKGFYFLGCTD